MPPICPPQIPLFPELWLTTCLASAAKCVVGAAQLLTAVRSYLSRQTNRLQYGRAIAFYRSYLLTTDVKK